MLCRHGKQKKIWKTEFPHSCINRKAERMRRIFCRLLFNGAPISFHFYEEKNIASNESGIIFDWICDVYYIQINRNQVPNRKKKRQPNKQSQPEKNKKKEEKGGTKRFEQWKARNACEIHEKHNVIIGSKRSAIRLLKMSKWYTFWCDQRTNWMSILLFTREEKKKWLKICSLAKNVLTKGERVCTITNKRMNNIRIENIRTA